MKIVMIGEAGNHRGRLEAALGPTQEIICLPREAASDPAWDAAIASDDAVISLRLRREKAPSFRLLHVPGAGLDGIDFEALAPETAVCNVFEHEIPIAEFVLGSLLNWEIRLDALRASMSPALWSDTYRNRVPHGELFGKTMGIVGFGRIGRAIATRAKAFGLRIVALDVLDPGDGLADRIVRPDQLGILLAEADYCIVTCPLLPSTRGMIGRDELAAMKPSAVLVNVSRAELVEQDALYEALAENRIGGAVLDVWYRYPLGADDQVAPSQFDFSALPNAVCTPHSSAWTSELPARRYGFIAANLGRLLRGEPLLNLVRPAAATLHA
ncbi:2-hydroxyacid dehydrogenase [Aureimonas glaciei]|uniref:Phosphoglycerate dehydrogenase n=1 Tax=Aureimonas glaciei TaxID=1776957 RepID=A0A916YCN4_9HYPH|nr:2-hydroxyacid dehydrogenase [Aureimonas glaciei]GGD39982.1 phosphoglycerate dehydrogenase [Aureimonas glaciei]